MPIAMDTVQQAELQVQESDKLSTAFMMQVFWDMVGSMLFLAAGVVLLWYFSGSKSFSEIDGARVPEFKFFSARLVYALLWIATALAIGKKDGDLLRENGIR